MAYESTQHHPPDTLTLPEGQHPGVSTFTSGNLTFFLTDRPQCLYPVPEQRRDQILPLASIAQANLGRLIEQTVRRLADKCSYLMAPSCYVADHFSAQLTVPQGR